MSEKKMGRPTIYKEEYDEQLVSWFEERRAAFEMHLNDKGNAQLIFKNFPTFEGFAHSINVLHKNLVDWKNDKRGNFCDAFARAKEIQLECLKIGGLSGAYNSNIAALLLSNDHNINKAENLNLGGQETPIKHEFSAKTISTSALDEIMTAVSAARKTSSDDDSSSE